MISIILVTHGKMAAGIKDAAEIIFGPQTNLYTVSYTPNIGPTELEEEVKETIKLCSTQNQILFIADIFGGSPYNIAATLVAADPNKRALISGLNLSMLLEAFSGRLTYHDVNQLTNYLVKISRSAIKKYDPNIQIKM
ncbi:MAG: PTS sugar transporter subunit IIA [Lactobacillaceae bacterium]